MTEKVFAVAFCFQQIENGRDGGVKSEKGKYFIWFGVVLFFFSDMISLSSFDLKTTNILVSDCLKLLIHYHSSLYCIITLRCLQVSNAYNKSLWNRSLEIVNASAAQKLHAFFTHLLNLCWRQYPYELHTSHKLSAQ